MIIEVHAPDWINDELVRLAAEEAIEQEFGKAMDAYRNGRLRYFGHSGTGFSEKGLKEAIDRLN